jgi:DNA (cytosine-5)-methyltransferase 1
MASCPAAIDLFGGAGGFSTGLRWAGFDVVRAIDRSEDCAQTYRRNHPRTEFRTADIREVDPEELSPDSERPALIAGGPPCPTFSSMGRGKLSSLGDITSEDQEASDQPVMLRDDGSPVDESNVLTDDRHYLFEEFIRYVRELQPRAFLMENVRGMQSAETRTGENVVSRITRKLRNAGYRVSVQELNAADYGVPQHRNRLFFIGNRAGRDNPVMRRWRTHRKPVNDREKKMKPRTRKEPSQATLARFGVESDQPFQSFHPDREHRGPWVTVGDAILDLPPVSPDGDTPPARATNYEIPPVSEYQEWVRGEPADRDRDELSLNNHECRGHNLTDLTLYKLLGEGVGWTIGELDEEFHPYRSDVFTDQYTKQNAREPATTVMAHIQKDGHLSIHPREARSFTVREAARLQSFRDTFVFPVSRTQAFHQVGNAVPPLVAEALGTAIRETLLDDVAT